MLNTLGTVTPPAVFLSVEIHKFHQAFTPSADIKAGQPVKLNTDGTIAPIVSGTDARDLMIGIAMNDITQASGLECTIIMRAYALVQAISSAACATGPVKYGGYDSTNLRIIYVHAIVGTDVTWGHALNAATATGQILDVAILP